MISFMYERCFILSKHIVLCIEADSALLCLLPSVLREILIRILVVEESFNISCSSVFARVVNKLCNGSRACGKYGVYLLHHIDIVKTLVLGK